MSRRSQDIPIRPRYGIPDLTNGENDSVEDRTTQTTRKISSYTMEAPSYSEIPFLAQYPERDHTAAVITATATAANKVVQQNSTGEQDVDDDDEEDNSNSKGSSYEDNKTPRRPNSLHCDSSFPYELEGATSTDGQMRHFVANNLEEKIRSGADQLSYVSHNSTPSGANVSGDILTRRFLQQQRPQIDANVLTDIEIEAQYLAASVDNLMENLCNLLHSISSITADNVEVHKNSVNKLTDSMDANIKCMYTIMAKTEEITKSMNPTEQLGQRIREIKRLVDMLDGTM